MNKEIKKNKKLYIALIAAVLAVIVAIIVTSVVLGVGSGDKNPSINDPLDNVGQLPDDETPGTTPDPDDNPGTTVPDPDEPTNTEQKYASPLETYTLGQECDVNEVVWSNTMHWFATHNGTDFMAESGSLVTAVYGGTVESVKYTTQEGYVVTVNQTDGNVAIYKSLSSDIIVQEGAAIAKGAQIGYVSDSMASEQNDGAHLHLEITDGEGNYIDPMSLLPAAPEK